MQPILATYKTAADFEKQFAVNEDIFDSFIAYASGSIKEMDSRELLLSKPAIECYLKASAARFKWGDNAFFQVTNSGDTAFNRAVAEIN
jgi:carboxyl-terminal processing protease